MTHTATSGYQRRLRYVRKLGQAKAWSHSEPGETVACGLEVRAGSMLSIGFGVAALRPLPRYQDSGVANESGDDWKVLPHIDNLSSLSAAKRRGQPTTTYHQQLSSPRQSKKLEPDTSMQTSLPPTPLSVNGNYLSSDRRFTSVSQQLDLVHRQQTHLSRTAGLMWQQRPLAPSATAPTAGPTAGRRLTRAATTVGVSFGKARATSSSTANATVGPWRGAPARLHVDSTTGHEDEAVLLLRHLHQSEKPCPLRPVGDSSFQDYESITDTPRISVRRKL